MWGHKSVTQLELSSKFGPFYSLHGFVAFIFGIWAVTVKSARENQADVANLPLASREHCPSLPVDAFQMEGHEGRAQGPTSASKQGMKDFR